MSDNIVKHGQLSDIAQDLWTKAKKRDIESFEFDSTTKTLKGKNSVDTTLSINVELTDLVSINDRAKFTKDVSVNDAGAATNINIGNVDNNQSKDRIVGYRGLTSKKFVDNYVEKLVIHTKSDLDDDTNTTWKVWSVKKGTNRDEDRIVKAYHNNGTISALSKTLSVNGVSRKCIEIPIREEFDSETYFLVKCTSHPMQVVVDIKQDFRADVVNISEEPSGTPGSTIRFNTNSDNNTAIIHLIGRESITSLAEKLRQTQADGSKYVLQSETTNTGGETQYANKVVKLGSDGKINSNMIPELAINRVLEAADESAALNKIGEGKDHLQVGDVVVLQNTNKIYIYKGRPDGQNDNNFRRDFLEIAMGNGTVKSVNTILPEANGNVTVNADNINLSSTDTTKVKAELDKKISTITLHNDKKHLTITKATGTTPEQLDLTNAFAADNISYSGQIGGATKNNVKEAIDALKDEANKGVKSIKGGRPNANGELDVTVNTAGNGITMTFGTTGGTPVQIATYMTDTEVNEIKALFR